MVRYTNFFAMKGSLVVFFVWSVIAASSGSDEPKKCQGENGALKYEVGRSYSYNFGIHAYGEFKFDLQSGENHKPVVHVNGTAILTAVSECEFILTLKNTIISSRPTNGKGQETETNKVGVDQSSLRFTMTNAAIQEIYFNPEDPSWLVNLKKTIIFMIQNKGLATADKDMQIESSVFGHCMTKYINNEKSFIKMTHLNKCGQGEGSDLISQGIPYQIPLVTNKPIFGFLRPGHVHCSQTLKDGILNDVICSEKNSGPTMVSVLKFSEKSNSIVKDEEMAKLFVPTSILFNFTKSYSKPMEDNSSEKMKQLITNLKQDGSNKADIFIELKKVAVRISDLEQFLDSKYISEDIHKKTFYDALAEVSTDEAIRLVANAANQGQLDAITLFNFYTNIAFATAPGTKSLQALSDVVKSWKIKKPESIDNQGDLKQMDAYKANISLGQHLLLGSSGLAHQYCKLINPQCLLDQAYQNLVDAIAGHINIKADEEDIVLGALHALGNLDALTPVAVEAVQSIFTQSTTPVWMEIQAMDAFRRDPCQATLKESVRKILGDSSKTDQVRIHAYLAASRCITSEDIKIIQDIFKQTNSAVVGFIGSHIRNTRDSSSPSKLQLKATLGEVLLPENIVAVHNRSRASKYIEHSTFNEKNNLGFSGEATVIFIPGQAQPEFVSFNATLDWYGRSFNFLEIGLSQRFLMKTMQVQGDDVPANWENIHMAATAKDAYYRVLGTTIALGLDNLHDAFQTSISKTLSGDLPGTVIDVIRPSSILDEELIFPTISGLPLNFDAQAVSFDSIKVELLGFTNFSSLFESNKAFDYKVTVNADSTVTLKGSMGLGAHTPVHTGYKVEGKIDHKQNYGVEISSKNGPTLDMDLKFNFPNQIINSKDLSIDVFGFEEIQGNLVKLRDAGKSGMVGESLNSQPRECLDFMQLFGLRKCHSSRNGDNFPRLFACSLEKENVEMQGFNVKIKSDGAEFSPTYELTVTTPGSQTSRLLKISVKLDQGNEQAAEYWETKEITVTAELDNKKYIGHAFWNRSEVVQFQSMLRHDNDLTIDYSDPNSKAPKQILKFVTNQPKEGEIHVGAKFDGPLALLGNFKYNYDKVFVRGTEGYGYEYMKRTKHFEWNSDVFGKTFGDFNSEFSRNGNSSVSAKISHNNRVYEVQHTGEVTTVFGEEVETAFGEKYRQTAERLEKHRVIVAYPNKQYELMFGSGFQKVSEDERRNNFTLDIKTPHHKKPISAKLLLVDQYEDRTSTGFFTVEYEGDKHVDISATSNRSAGLYEVVCDLKNKGKFFGNLTDDGRHQHIHMDIKCITEQVEIVIDSDLTDDGNEFKQKTDLLVDDKKHKKIIKSESFTVIDRTKRSMDYMSKTTREKDQLLAKFQMHGEVPPELWNGKSFVNMRLEDQSGKVYTGTINETLAKSKDRNRIKSNLEMDFHQPGGAVPFTYNWDLMVDYTPKDDVHDFEYHITSDKHFTGAILAPFDILIQKDIHFHQKKGRNEYELISSSNITSNGKLERTTNVDMTITAHDDKWKSITVQTNGDTQAGNFKDTFNGQLDAQEMPDKQRGSIQRVSFKVDRTDLQTKVTSNLIDGTANKTSYFHDITDFEITENVRVKMQENRIYNSVELIKFHNNELIIFKEIEEIDGKDVRDTKFLIDISVKVTDENHQTKVVLRSRNSLSHPDCPVNNANFTLSK